MPKELIGKGLTVEQGPNETVRLNFGKEGDADVYAYFDLTDRQARVLIGRLMKIVGIELVTLTPEGDLVMKDF